MVASFFVLLLACKPDASRTRQEFVDAYNKVRGGETKAQVRAMLGLPDDVITELDPHMDYVADDDGEIWRWGTSGHLTFATLGAVAFDSKGKVEAVIPQDDYRGSPAIKEEQLRKAVQAFDLEYPRHSVEPTLDPLTAIRVASRLLAFDQATILAAARTYGSAEMLRDDQARYKQAALALKLLFKPKSGSPALYYWPGPAFVVEDIPLSAGNSAPWGPGDSGAYLGRDVDYLEKYGALRVELIAPPHDPLRVLDRLYASPNWYFEKSYNPADPASPVPLGYIDNAKQSFNREIGLLTRTVWPSVSVKAAFTADFSKTWAQAEPAVAAMNLRWDPKGLRYTRADGAHDDPPEPTPKRFLWKPARHMRVALDHVTCGQFTFIDWIEQENWLQNDDDPYVVVKTGTGSFTYDSFYRKVHKNADAWDIETHSGRGIAVVLYKEGDPITLELRRGDKVIARTKTRFE